MNTFSASKAFDLHSIVPVDDYSPPTELALGRPLTDWMSAALEHPKIIELYLKKLWATPAASTISSPERAIIYALMRETKPQASLEIGTYHAGTTQLMAVAAYQDGGGVFTIDPYGAERVPQLLSQWPEELRRVVQFRAQFSTEFLGPIHQLPLFGFIFIDGDHRFPNVIHDLYACDENLLHDGLMVVDNCELPDVMEGCRKFLEDSPGYEAVAVHVFLHHGSQVSTQVTGKLANVESLATFCVLRKPKALRLYHRQADFNLFLIRDREAPVLRLMGHADSPSGVRLLCHMRAFMRGTHDPKAITIKSKHDLQLPEGNFNLKIDPQLVLPEWAIGQILTAQIILQPITSDGSVRVDSLHWGDVPLRPYRNALPDSN